MGDLGLEVGWQIDDMDGAKGTFLRTDTATNTQSFRDICDFGLGCDFDTEFAGTDDRAGLFAFLPAFLNGVSGNDWLCLSRRCVCYLWLALLGREIPD